MNAIEIKGLTKYYGKSKGIEALDLSAAEGEFFGFIGPNGAGKSTTVRILLGLLKADSGSATVLGKDIRTQKERILAEVGYLPSETVFYPGMRVRDVIRFSASLRGTPCPDAAGLCERLQLDTSKKAAQLSLGNRKKLGIVCALQSRPKLCILDEPTSGLDPLMQRAFFAILKELHAQGTTIFLSSHILSEIQHHCTRAAVIREGHIIACGSVADLAQTSAKRVQVQGAVDVSALPGIKDLQQSENSQRFLYSGDITRLVQILASQPVTDLTVTEPDLEEIFMHYYQQDTGQEAT